MVAEMVWSFELGSVQIGRNVRIHNAVASLNNAVALTARRGLSIELS